MLVISAAAPSATEKLLRRLVAFESGERNRGEEVVMEGKGSWKKESWSVAMMGKLKSSILSSLLLLLLIPSLFWSLIIARVQ